jgi:hypothetical protein
VPITREEKEKEIKQIKLIATNNRYIMKVARNSYKKEDSSEPTRNITSEGDKKWAKFTYFREDIRILTRIFNNTRLKVACGVGNTIRTWVTTFRRRFCGTPSVTNPPAR